MSMHKKQNNIFVFISLVSLKISIIGLTIVWYDVILILSAIIETKNSLKMMEIGIFKGYLKL